MAGLLKFAPFSSSPDASFWHALASRKLNDFKLSETLRPVHGFYQSGTRPELPSRMVMADKAFESDVDAGRPPRGVVSSGALYNFNTRAAFKEADLAMPVSNAVTKIWEAIESGAALEDASSLNQFALLTFSDLKKYHFYYWFAFPALKLDGEVEAVEVLRGLESTHSPEMINSLSSQLKDNPTLRAACLLKAGADQQSVELAPLSRFGDFFGAAEPTVVFLDPCGLASNPGWCLRNILAAIVHRFGSKCATVRVICFREKVMSNVADCEHSLVLRLKLPSAVAMANGRPKFVKGWEKNHKNTAAPRVCNLSASMDPYRLAETAVDLNLRLMRWRIQPAIDLPKIAGTKCLLLGAGTLGCNVARCLMGWGVRKITFVDSGSVSFSNPARQSLYQYEDCLEGGKPKAETAAKRLKEVFPGVDATGVMLSIPMPGHPLDSEAAVAAGKKAVEQLDALIEEHDAVFLLLDTRESRWLPSVMGAAKEKLVFTAAVGFDTYVAMRHGLSDPDSGRRVVGCYFCNDVIAPTNSTKDRTLDQQCTVSRPGLSMLVSGHVAELLVAVLHHKLGGRCPAAGDIDATPIGAVPHQIRGMLRSFNNMVIAGESFSKCTACSPQVVQAYRTKGFEFLLKAFNSPTYLEELTGLQEMHTAVDDMSWDDDDFDFDDDDGEFGDGELGDATEDGDAGEPAAASVRTASL